jgi:N-acetylmuramoyl-L-alanine amidase
MKKFITQLIIILFALNSSYADELPQSILMALNTKISLIAIDPGFGGRETGPSCFDNQAFAKDINLAISTRIANKIKNDLGLDALLTRESDQYVSLEERTSIANLKNADLFISIHVNGFSDPNVNGIETYCLNLVTDNEAIRIASSEDSTSPKTMQDMDIIVRELMQNTNVTESGTLAKVVHNSLVSVLDAKYDNIKDRGVKNAPLYVLLGTSMPSILVQPSFITNKRECGRLLTDEYQEIISSGIVRGIGKYIKEQRN